MSQFNKLYNRIIKEDAPWKEWTEEHKKPVIYVLKKYGLYEEYEDLLDMICDEMYYYNQLDPLAIRSLSYEKLKQILCYVV